MRMFSINLGGGSGGIPGIPVLQGSVNTTAITNGQDDVSPTFSTDLGSTNYSIVCSLGNYTDPNPIYPEILSTTKTSAGFTVTLDAPVDSANYVLEWVAVLHA